jgi:hypothetical protein
LNSIFSLAASILALMASSLSCNSRIDGIWEPLSGHLAKSTGQLCLLKSRGRHCRGWDVGKRASHSKHLHQRIGNLRAAMQPAKPKHPPAIPVSNL